MANIAKLLVSLGLDAADYVSGIGTAIGYTDQFAGQVNSAISTTVTAGFAAGTAAVTAFAATSVNAAGDFEAGMNTFASVTGSSVAEAGYSLDDFQAKFLELGAETSFSAAQAQQAAIELAKGGISVAEVMEGATSATLDLASAGSLELADAATIVAKTLGVWGETGVTAADVANQLAQAANASTVDVDELALGLANVQGVAKTAGVSFGDLTQTMALIAPQFASAADGGTSLKTFISRLIPTTDDAASAMQELGLMTFDTNRVIADFKLPPGSTIEDAKDALGEYAATMGLTADETAALSAKYNSSVFFDAEGQFIGMAGAAEALQNATAHLSEEQRLLAFNTIFGSDAVRAAAAIANAGSEGFNTMGASMLAAGSAADQAAIKNQGFKFALDSAMGSVETLQIIIGMALLPVLTDLINTALIPAINWITQFITTLQASPDPINTIVSTLMPFNSTLAALAGYFAVVITDGDRFNDFLTQLPEPIATLLPLIMQLGDLIGANLQPILAGVAIVAGVLVVSALASMIAAAFAVVAPIMALVAIAAVLYSAWSSNFLNIQGITNSVLNVLIGAITNAGNWIMSFWATYGATITADTLQTWNIIYTTVNTLLSSVVTIVLTLFTRITTFIQDNSALISFILANAWQFITGMIRGAALVIQGIVQVFTGIITGDFETLKAGLSNIVQGIATMLETVFNAGLNTVIGLITLALNTITSIFGGFWDTAKSLGKGIIDGIIEGVSSAASALADTVTNAVNDAVDAAKSALGISSPSKVAAAVIGKPFVQGIIAGADSMLGALTATGANLANTLVQASVPASGNASALGMGAANEASTSGGGTQYNVNASYTTVQSEETLRDTLRKVALVGIG